MPNHKGKPLRMITIKRTKMSKLTRINANGAKNMNITRRIVQIS